MQIHSHCVVVAHQNTVHGSILKLNLCLFCRDSSDSSLRQSGEIEDRHRDTGLHKQVHVILISKLVNFILSRVFRFIADQTDSIYDYSSMCSLSKICTACIDMQKPLWHPL